MTPLLAGLGLAGCYLLGLRGFVLARDPGLATRLLQRDHVRTPVEEGPQRPLVRAYLALVDRLAPRALRLLGTARIERIRKRIDAAGRPAGMTMEGYAGKKAFFTLLFGVTALLLALQGRLVIGGILAIAGYWWTDLVLHAEARRRQQAIERDLPDFLDILAVTVGAGIGLRPGMHRVAHTLHGPIAEEVRTTLGRMDVGATRRAAFEELRRRNPSESLGQFVTAMLQAEELGTPLARALVDIAGDMRRSAAQAARRRAARAAPRVSLIVTTVMVPGVLILLGVALFLGVSPDLGRLLD